LEDLFVSLYSAVST